MGVLDFRRFLPGVMPPDGGFINVPTSGPGTFSVPVQSDGAPQQDPPPAAPDKYGPLNPTGKSPVLAGVGGATTLSPIGTTAPVTPPVTPPGLKEVYGPGASQPSVTQAPTKPVEPAFNPDVREAVRGAVAAQGTPAVQAGNFYDKLMAATKDPKFGPAIAALAKGMGGGSKAPEAHQAPFPRLDPAPNISGQLGGIASQAGQAMGDIRKKLAVFGPKPKKARTDDPHDREQDTYDFRRLKGRG
jgi:hypothetical protein